LFPQFTYLIEQFALQLLHFDYRGTIRGVGLCLCDDVLRSEEKDEESESGYEMQCPEQSHGQPLN
jgi:hypothetical protein